MEDGAPLLSLAMAGRDVDWEIGVLKALAKEASMGVRGRIAREWLD